MRQFSDQIVWITGASAGIGEALAKEAANQGAKLILSARRIKELDRVAKECGLSDDQYLILPMDMTQYNDFSSLVNVVIDKFGRIDYLFNNAGVSTRALASETPVEVDKRVMDINYFGSIALTKAVLPFMSQRKKGNIIVTSSVVGYFATPMRSAYAASKHALHGFYNALREEIYGDNIIITILCPGYIKTNISVNALKSDGEKFNKMSVNQAAGMDPDVLARKVLKAVKKNHRNINIGGSELFGIYLHRFAPGLLSKILRKKQSKNSFTQ